MERDVVVYLGRCKHGLTEARVMAHFKRITASRAAAPVSAIDPAGQAFLQLWLNVMTWLIQGLFASKGEAPA